MLMPDRTHGNIYPDGQKTGIIEKGEKRNVMVLVLLALYGIDSILSQPVLGNAQYGVCIIDLTSDSIVFARNSQKLLIPASNMKIVSTATSLCYLGPDYRYRTRLALQGTVKGNVLHGDLVLIGGGDPTLRSNALEQFVQTLRTKHVRTVTGDIIIDDSFFTELSLHGNGFTYERLPVGWAWHYLDARYAAEISALSLNKNYVNVVMEPTSPGEYARVRIEPETQYLQLVSRMKTIQAKDSIIVFRKPGTNIIYVDGGIGDKRKRTIPVSVMDPARFAGHLFRELLEDSGITVRGNVVMLDERDEMVMTGSSRVVVDSVVSPELIDILRETNVESVNLYAEVLLKTLGARYYGEGSFNNGIMIMKRFLRVCGADTSMVSLWDGSGLSRHNLISPYVMSLVLRYMYLSRYADTFINLLPSNGEGTLEWRFNDLDGNVRAKTGSLHAVSCLSGYLRVAEHDYCFSIMFNNFTCPRKTIEQVQEDIIYALAGQRGPG